MYMQVNNKPYHCGKYAFILEQGCGCEQQLSPKQKSSAKQIKSVILAPCRS
jgi:hypothetical protein